MFTFQVSINYGGNETEELVSAASAAEAIEIVRNALPARVARWANVFVA